MTKDALVPIGELARSTGVATSALRYYERLGLLSHAELSSQGRRYTPESAERVAFIRLCQDAGFTLAETGRLLDAWGGGREPGDREPRGWRQLAERKVAELDDRIADAQRAKELVQHGLDCPHRDPNTCPNFRAALEARLNASDPECH
jgi:DNA-binding transcriptional MerR regulator